jgi:hypothetical protein
MIVNAELYKNQNMSIFTKKSVSESPLVFVVESEMPAAIWRYLLQQTYLIFPIFIQKIILSTVNGVHVSFDALSLAYRIFS